jgi:hypothetical protein
VHHLVVDVQAADIDHDWIGGGQQGTDDHAGDQYGPERQDQGPQFRAERKASHLVILSLP